MGNWKIENRETEMRSTLIWFKILRDIFNQSEKDTKTIMTYRFARVSMRSAQVQFSAFRYDWLL